MAKQQRQALANIDDQLERGEVPPAPVAVPWKALVRGLADTDEIRRYWDRLLERVGDGGNGPNDAEDVADLLLTREFFRRPKRRNSMETLGLAAVAYDGVADATPPAEWHGRGLVELDAAAWRNFLTFLLDFVARGNGAWAFPKWYAGWLGPFATPRGLVEPGVDYVGPSRSVVWPQDRGGNPTRAARVLRAMLGDRADDAAGRELVNALLTKAFRQVQQTALRRGDDDLFRLRADALALRPPTAAYRCPLSGRVLADPPAGLSPYASPGSPPVRCEPIRLPTPRRELFEASSAERAEAARAWLDADPLVAEARRLNVWTDVSDRIVSFPGHVSVAEHSAQIGSRELGRGRGAVQGRRAQRAELLDDDGDGHRHRLADGGGDEQRSAGAGELLAAVRPGRAAGSAAGGVADDV